MTATFTTRRAWLGAALVSCCAGLSLQAHAQPTDFPNRVVRIVSPYTAGGPNDALARLLAGKLAERWGQPVIVENKPGANAITGSDYVAKARPDGYTLLTIPAAHVTNPYLRTGMPLNPATDLTAVSILATVPLILASSSQLPAKNLAELLAWGRANPGKLTFASNGAGSGSHLAGELFAQATGINMLHIPYKGTSAALPDVISGQVSMIFDTLQATTPHIKAGKLVPMGMTSLRRWPSEPGIPTVSEAGVNGFVADTWVALVTASGAPKEVQEKISADVAAILKMPDVREKLLAFGHEPVGGTPAEANRFVADESAKWGRIIKTANIKVD